MVWSKMTCGTVVNCDGWGRGRELTRSSHDEFFARTKHLTLVIRLTTTRRPSPHLFDSYYL